MKYHPLANIFPLMEGAAFDALVADIKANGVRDPIVMYEDVLLDGRNRWRAAEAAGITITGKDVRQFDPEKDGDPLAWVISKNLQRRHLDESQRAMAAAKIATLRDGQRQVGKFAHVATQAEAATLLNVSERSVKSAAVVRDRGTPELQHAVEAGQIAVHLAARATKLTKPQQRKIAEKAATGRVTALLRKIAKEEDEARVLSLAPVVGKFSTLVIDPPWDYEWLSIAGRASPGYAVMTHEELMALDVLQWARDDCAMYLWVTNNFMTRGVELMKHWGFQHKTVLTWVKPRIGLGSYFRNSTEHVLFGTRGNAKTRRDDIPTHFEAPTTGHSIKPEKFYEIVRVASYPEYGEIFAREARPDFKNLYQTKMMVEAAAGSGPRAADE
jgi:N6-adenosine-specific RNA methylase IME4